MRFVRAWNPQRWFAPFAAIWGAEAMSLFGTQLVQFALVWSIARDTKSATVLAGATLVALFPQIVIAPLAGAIVDRWDRRWVMIFANAGIALTTIALILLFAFGEVEIWHIYLTMFLRAAAGAFRWPAMQASTAMMVPERHLARVAGLNNGLFGLASIVSPSLGALLIEFGLPMYVLLTVDVAAACLAILPLALVRIPLPERPAMPMARGSILADLRDGLRFVTGWRTLFAIVAAAAAITLLSQPALSLLPLLVTKHFGRGAIEFGGMQSAFGFGMGAGAALLGIWGGFKKRMVTALLALLLQGVGFAAIGLVPASGFAIAVAAMALVGLMNPICTGSLFAIVQSTVPHNIQGRVMSLLISLSTAAAPLGLALAGPIADRFGIGVWFAVAGAVMFAVAAVCLVTPAVREVEARGAPPHLRQTAHAGPSAPAGS